MSATDNTEGTTAFPTDIIPFIDGHNDTLLRLYRAGRDHENAFLTGSENHIDLPRALDARMSGFFAIFSPSPSRGMANLPDQGSYELPLPDPLPLEDARAMTLAMMATLFRLERGSSPQFQVVRDVAQLRRCVTSGTVGAVLHIEGADAIDEDLDTLEVFYQTGLRSLGIVWSRPNAFGHGVPFKFPGSPDTGPGLSDAGAALVRACNELGILVDLSHLNEQGFWDVAKTSNAPLVATHSNVHAICPSARNLTDKQLEAIAETGGMVGLNFALSFLREDGKKDPNTPLEVMVRHLDYLIDKLGVDHVGFGSDFDGTDVPQEIGDVTGVAKLLAALRDHGYDEPTLHKLAYQNWLGVLEKTWK